jgi:hypothetical protein
MKTLRRLLAFGGGAALSIGFMFIGVGSAQAADKATVSILHGVPGATVDVYANGEALLKNFKPGTLTDPQMLPAGSYDLKVVKAGDGPDGDAIVEANNVKVPGGANITVVAHLTAKGKPALTPYVNDVSMISPGEARIIVRHDAAAPAVDITQQVFVGGARRGDSAIAASARHHPPNGFLGGTELFPDRRATAVAIGHRQEPCPASSPAVTCPARGGDLVVHVNSALLAGHQVLGPRSRSLAAEGNGGRSSRWPQHLDSSLVPEPR